MENACEFYVQISKDKWIFAKIESKQTAKKFKIKSPQHREHQGQRYMFKIYFEDGKNSTAFVRAMASKINEKGLNRGRHEFDCEGLFRQRNCGFEIDSLITWKLIKMNKPTSSLKQILALWNSHKDHIMSDGNLL